MKQQDATQSILESNIFPTELSFPHTSDANPYMQV